MELLNIWQIEFSVDFTVTLVLFFCMFSQHGYFKFVEASAMRQPLKKKKEESEAFLFVFGKRNGYVISLIHDLSKVKKI